MSTPGTRPNILFLFSEQHHPDVLSPAGHPRVRTPHLQRLADEGVYVRNAYCATPLCIPSRTSTILGRFSHDTGIVDNKNYEDQIGDQPNLARNLREAGYLTCHIGKTHLGTSWDESFERMDRLGFEDSLATRGKIGMARDWEGDPYIEFQNRKGIRKRFVADYEQRARVRKAGDMCDTHSSVLQAEETHDGWISDKAAAWLEQVDTDRPFYLSVNWAGPHVYRDPPASYAGMYDPGSMDLPVSDPPENLPRAWRTRQQKETADTQPSDWQRYRAAYYAQISMIDDGVGRILEVLEQRGLLDHTLILFTADHGEMLMDHGFQGKQLMYESAARVPFLARYPAAFPAGARPGSCLSLVDIAPTLLEWGHAAPLPVLHGQSLTSLLTGKADERDQVFSEFKTLRMMRKGLWKLVEDPEHDVLQLFHLGDDPEELRNLSDTHPERVTEMQKEIKTWLSRTTT